MLLSSNPSGGARLDAAPTSATVTLTEAVEPSSARLRVLDQAGARVDLDDLQFTGGDRPVLTVSLQANLTDGAYRILWSAVSADTHPVSGTIGFAVGAFEPPASSGTGGGGPSSVGIVGRVLVYAGLALAFGGILFLAGIGQPVAREARAPRTALFAGANLHLGGVALLAYAYVDASPAGALEAAATHVGRVLGLRLILGVGALALLILGLRPVTRHPSQPALAATLLALAGLGSALMGHPVVHGLGAVAVDYIHLVASLVWVGGLVVFLWLLRVDAPALDARTLTQLGIRFGTFALLCVLALFAAGMASTLLLLGPRMIGHPIALISSAWGAFLAAKIGLALVMLGLAGINRYVLLAPPQVTGWVGRLQSASARAVPSLRPLAAGGETGSFRRGLAIEAGLGVVVLVLAALLASISPPTLADEAGPLEVSAQGGAYTYRLRFEPTPHVGGSSQLTVWIADLNGQPLVSNECGRESCVEVHLADPANPTQQEEYDLTPGPDGGWTHMGILWARSGPTLVSIHAASATVFEDEATVEIVVD